MRERRERAPRAVRIGSERVFDGKLIHVRVDTVRLPSGRESVREVVEHPGAVVIIPITEESEVLLVKQQRYVTGETLLELPAGLIDAGEDPEETARRELREETGYEADGLTFLTQVYSSPGFSEEQVSFYLATGCTPVETEFDEDEGIELATMPLIKVPRLLTPGETYIVNGMTMIGLLWLIRSDLDLMGL